VSPCTHCIDVFVADRAYYLVIYYIPGVPKVDAVCEAEVSIIVSRNIGIAVMYTDADEVVNQVISKL
jgi:hypothetical protein